MGKTLRNTLLGIVTAGLLGVASYKTCDYITTIRPEKCENWIKVNTHKNSGGLWDFYTAEGIYQREKNWRIYQEAVESKNNGKAKGRVYVPDLDNNGVVGK